MASVELVIVGFLSIMMIASLVSMRGRIPYTLVLVLIGISLAVLSGTFLVGGGQLEDIILQIRSFFFNLTVPGSPGGLFVGLVVPPLIFEAMMQIKSSDLRDVIKPAVVLATVGVVIATLVGGVFLWELAGLPIVVSFLFAAIIAPTDPATVLEIFRRAKVPSKLAALLDTEAAFNDATGIVIFTAILASVALPRPSALQIATNFAITLGGGLIVGFGVAFLAELVASMVSDPLSETVLTITAVYGSYALAAGFGFSGLVAVSVVGLYFGNLTIRSVLQPKTREAVKAFWAIAAFFGNSIAFLYIGFQTDIFTLLPSLGLIAIAYLAVIVARFATVYPILTFFDRIGDKIPLRWRNVAMLGGARGALSIAMVAYLASFTAVSSVDDDKITAMVLGVALISISLQAAVLFRYMRSRFPEEREQTEEFNARLLRTVSTIEAFQNLRDEGKMSEEEFTRSLQIEGNELAEMLTGMHSTMGPTFIIKSRASRIYSLIRRLIKRMTIQPVTNRILVSPNNDNKPTEQRLTGSDGKAIVSETENDSKDDV